VIDPDGRLNRMFSARRRDRPACLNRQPTQWPWVLLATFAVAVLPVLVVSAIQATGALGSTLSSVAAAAALSVGASAAGSALWSRRRGSRDVVFADLMIWGWVRRLRSERRLADASKLLGDRAKLSPSRQAELLERLSAALEARDVYTHGHSRRVTRYSEAIGRGMGLTREQVAKVRAAAAVHDVGKIKTPRDLLNKPGRLTDEEFAAIKLHPVDGAELVMGMGDRELTAMVRHHHERLDGRGYPDGLGAAEIPLGARIIAVADTFDAITSTRPYRAAGNHKMALDTLRIEAGSQLDPAAVAAFLSYYSGRRGVALWSLFVTEPPRVVSWLLGWLQRAGATPIATAVIAAGATALGATLASPPAPEASIRSNSAVAAVTQGPGERTGSAGTAAAGPTPRQSARPTPRQSAARSPRSGDRAGRRLHRRSRRRSLLPAGLPTRSRSPGSRPVSRSEPEAGYGGAGSGSGSGSGGSGGGGSGSGGGGSHGGSGGGSGTGSETGSAPEPLPTIDPPDLPPLPAEVPPPETQHPQHPQHPEHPEHPSLPETAVEYAPPHRCDAPLTC
jgi:HD-GYP domain-containing protein (c-di-GMP phosphodiesterase class II)